MLSEDAKRIHASLSRIGKMSGRISIAFKVVLAIDIVLAVLLFGSSVAGALVPSLFPFSTLAFGLGLIPMLLSVITSCAVLFVIAKVFEDISKGSSPFTFIQSKRIGLVGGLLVAGVVVEAFISPDFSSMVSVNGADFGFDATLRENPTVFINRLYLIGAIVCFCLSYVFKYGALLQRLSDDLFRRTAWR